MPSRDEVDTRFSLPAIDDSPLTETGVILLGMDAERLLAGLGMAALADDPALVALAVDQARHDADVRMPFDALVETGCHRWRLARPALSGAGRSGSTPAPLRQAWTQTLQLVAAADLGALGDVGPATRAHLAACWLRRDAVDRCAAEREGTDDVVSAVIAT